tara:strand:- start:36 stop:266 length:231 start_codon:yes stop_codon:yes gene_type:complete
MQIKLIINDQNYFKNFLKKFPHLSSGRKNYDIQYDRILTNILITKLYKNKFSKKKFKIFNNLKILKNKKTMKIIYK